MNVIGEIKHLQRRVQQLEISLGVECPPPVGDTLNLGIDGKNYLTILANGDVLIRGRKVGNDTDILRGLQEFLKAMKTNQEVEKILLSTPAKGEA